MSSGVGRTRGSVGRGAELARKALEKLLERAENAWARVPGDGEPSSGGRAPSLKFSQDSFPEYSRLERHADKIECNAAIQLAERDGAVTIDWDARAGERNQVERIVLRDGPCLAIHLGVLPRWEAVEVAERKLAEFFGRYPVLMQVVQTWKRGGVVRGFRVNDVDVWLEAIQVQSYCTSKSGDDVPIRRLSASLFGDSKRIEALWPILDVLASGDPGASPKDAEEVYSGLGLVKFPPTILVAGELALVYGGRSIRAYSPYVGLAPKAIDAVSAEPAAAQMLLSVENLTTFHEMASVRPAGAILIYTGGMPSPSWKHAYRLLLDSLPVSAMIFHWGDIDAGGFRIASHLAECCVIATRSLRLHGMVSRATGVAARTLTKSEASEIRRICDRWGWDDEASGLGTVAVEQESLPVFWPVL
jgi:hypothetical protein